MSGPRIVVAGAGVMGLATALALARRGARVSVDDPASAGENASAVAAGMLAPAFESALDPLVRPHHDLLLAARDLWPAFATRTGVIVDSRPALAVGETAWLEETAVRLRSLGVSFDEPSPAALNAAAPGLAASFRRALAVEGDWRIDADQALAALRRAAEAAGVCFRTRAATGTEPCDVFVVATGAGRDLIALAPELVRIAPIKGHILRAPGALARVIRSQGVYLAPAAGGVAIGASMEAGLADRRIDSGQVGRLRAAAARLFPALAEAPVTAAAGVRGATSDGLPLVGPSASARVVLVAGARRNGWLLAPLAAEIAAACALGDDPGPFAERLNPDRFGRG